MLNKTRKRSSRPNYEITHCEIRRLQNFVS